jgi:hypothetical protein
VSSKVWVVVAGVVVVAVGVVAFVSYGHGAGSGSSPGQRLASWASSTGLGQDIGTMEGDASHVRETLADHEGTGDVHTVCAAMANDAQTFNDELPSPDAEVTQLLARAYGLEYDAAEACYRAGATNRALLAQSARDRKRATSLFDRVVHEVRSVTGSAFSTTTTTVADETSTSLF